ncbi:ABC transporter permease [uncultured Clostridium sp.]|uniref:ABC transporter permease n=1 Tax=uncultured Clostridium sp. TaxID=59620 RepID=UPI0025ED2236|nr:ABC transporter permease [uncultured Clostridium sp.]
MLWKEYSRNYLKYNKASSFSVMAASLVSSLFISFITVLFYNMRVDQLRRAVADGREQEAAQLTMLTWFYIAVMFLVCTAMALVLYHAFVMGANERLHQLGILQSAGATPGQIRICILQEAVALSFLPVLIGIAAGAGLTVLFFRMAESMTEPLGIEPSVFVYHPLLFIATFAVCAATVLTAGARAAAKLGRISTLDAVCGGRAHPDGKIPSYLFFPKLFGIEWEIAGKSLYLRRRAYRTSAISLTLSFFTFGIFMNFWALSGVSTQYTYFERYRNVWDLMVTLKQQPEADARLLEDIRKIAEISECTAYRKLPGRTLIGEDMLSKELKAAGGIEALKDTGITKRGGEYLVDTPIVVLDDESFKAFLKETGIAAPGVETVTVNRIWDNVNSHFREKTYLPFLTPENNSIDVWEGRGEPWADGAGEADERGMFRLELGAFAEKGPDLREDFEDFSLVQIVPESIYQKKLAAVFPDGGMYFKIRTVSEEKLKAAEEKLAGLLQGKYEYQLENRRTEEAFEEKVRDGYKVLVGTLCGLLAFVGIVNVFANTIGGVYMRRREFARYLSVGFTPGGLAKILAMESCITALKPILISLPFQIMFVIYAVNASKLRYSDYLPVMPLIPMAAFAGAVFLSVGAAYYMAGRKITGLNIVEGLKDDTMF